MLLHNLFFLFLTLAIYFTLMPLVENRVVAAKTREITLIWNTFANVTPDNGEVELRVYELKTGAGDELGLPQQAQEWMRRYPGRIWRGDEASSYLYKLIPGSDRFYRLTLPIEFYEQLEASVRFAVFTVLGICYVLAVLLLELVIMPKHVYQPLRLLLSADAATRRDDREAEIIPESYIPGDEIGLIMDSHNQTVRALRGREDDLERALLKLEETAIDLRKKNELLEAAQRNLEAQDRLVSLGLLSASVAHEMNTPLAVLHGSIEKLLETVHEPGAQARLERMVRVTGRLRKISESLLDFARVRQQELTPVALEPIIDEAWQLVAIDEKASGVHFHHPARRNHLVLGNADKLIQVFVNLLRNALNAVSANGSVWVSVDPDLIDGRPAYAIRVEDNGKGIPADVLPGIFEAFVTTRLDAKGTGLGLTVVEGIVHQHGGAISASNRQEGGACLTVVLPAAEPQA